MGFGLGRRTVAPGDPLSVAEPPQKADSFLTAEYFLGPIARVLIGGCHENVGHAPSSSAWINGAPLYVRLYRHPRNRSLGCYYADLVGSAARGGESLLVLQLAY